MIHQFDVFRNPIRAQRALKPYVVCVQHDSFGGLTTRVVAALAARPPKFDQPRTAPAVRVAKETVYLDPTDLITLPVQFLGVAITNVQSQRDRIIPALDLVITGV
jgi:toxin CcdB